MAEVQHPETRLYRSPYPCFEVPTVPLWDFIFNKKKREDGSHRVVYLEEDTNERLRFSELEKRSVELAQSLLQIGLKRGDTVIIFSENTIQFPVLVFALFQTGIICSPANSLYHPEELAYQITDSNAAAVITSPTRLETAKTACQLSGLSGALYVLSDQNIGGVPGIDWSRTGVAKLRQPDQVSVDSIALLCYSSGTSGQPKGVQLSHRNLISAILQAMTMTPSSFTTEEVWIGVLPMAHMFGIIVHILMASHIRAKVVIFRQFHLKRLASAIERHCATACHIVPPIAVQLTKEDLEPSMYKFSSLREWRTGAAPLGKDLQSLLEAKWGVPVYSWYGMSETGGIVTISDASTQIEPGAIGILAPNMVAKILGNGELCLKGPNIMSGYQNRPKVNAETFDGEGFMRTGDVVEVDGEGYIYILDRIKEIIKYNGYQVTPAELEDLLLKHDDVNDVAVVGMVDTARATELPLAFVVLPDRIAGGGPKMLDLKRTEIQKYVAERVAQHKRLRGGVVFVNKIPKSPSGKILRMKLREYLGTTWLSLSLEERQNVMTLLF